MNYTASFPGHKCYEAGNSATIMKFFSSELFKFLRELKRHNDRDWFQANKWRYEQFVRDPFLRFIEDFGPRLRAISPHFIADPKPSGGSLLRIYRDMRFRKDQAPYQTMAAARFPHRAWKEVRTPGLYLHLAPKQCFLGAGLWHPDPDTRALVCATIVRDPAKWKSATSGRAFKSICELSGESMKRMPAGYDPGHQFARDLARKDFISVTHFTDGQVCASDFLDQVTKASRAAGPFMEFLTRALGLPWRANEKQKAREVLRRNTPRLT
jgi:uncharacterized protein (TIGR02453 family)